MEIQTTIENFSEKIKCLNLPPQTSVRVIIEKLRRKPKVRKTTPYLPFLYSGIWDDEDGPADISENTDAYLYDSDNIHGCQTVY